jgi:hypothetical protein
MESGLEFEDLDLEEETGFEDDFIGKIRCLFDDVISIDSITNGS